MSYKEHGMQKMLQLPVLFSTTQTVPGTMAGLTPRDLKGSEEYYKVHKQVKKWTAVGNKII